MADHAPPERTDSAVHPLRPATLAAAALLAAAIAAPPAAAQQPAEFTSTANRLLVAEAHMADPRFAETVVYMVWHTVDGGALGLIVNRPVANLPKASLQDALGDANPPLPGAIVGHYGGPVEPARVFALAPPLEPDTRDTPPTVATSPAEILDVLTEQRSDPQSPPKFTFGYAGWAPGQLAGELARGDWLVIDYDNDLVFDTPPDAAWRRAQDRRRLDL